MTYSPLKPKQKRLQSCDLKAPKRAKISKNRVDDSRDSFKIAGFVGDDAGNLENAGKIRQPQPNIKLLGKYPSKGLQMKTNDLAFRVWLVMSLAWVLISLSLTVTVSDEIFGWDGGRLPYMIVTFSVLSMGAFVSAIYDWIVQSSRLRWVHAVIATLLCLITWGSNIDTDAVYLASIGWWVIFISSYTLLGISKGYHFSTTTTPQELPEAGENSAAPNTKNYQWEKFRSLSITFFWHVLRLFIAVAVLLVFGVVSILLVQLFLKTDVSEAGRLGTPLAFIVWIPTWYLIIRRRRPVWQPGRRFWFRWFVTQLIGIPLVIIDTSGGTWLVLQGVFLVLIVIFIFDAVINFRQFEVSKPRTVSPDQGDRIWP